MLIADRLEQKPYKLPSPVLRDNGSYIVHMALASPSFHTYAQHGEVWIPPETLSDPLWLEAIAGVPLIDDDQGAHHDGVNLDEPSRIGQILNAYWDDEQQIPVGRAVVDTVRGIRKIAEEKITGVSPAYDADFLDEEGTTPDGRAYTKVQRNRRNPDNVTITTAPRGSKAFLQADSKDETMTPEEIKAAISDAMAPFGERLKAVEDAMTTPDEPEEEADDKADATMEDLAEVKVTADAYEVEIANTMSVADARKAIAEKVLGRSVDGMTADAIKATVSGAAAGVRAKVSDSAWDQWRAGTKQNPQGGQAEDTNIPDDLYT